MNERKKAGIFLLGMFTLVFAAGWIGHITYVDYSTDRFYDGLLLQNYTYDEAYDTAYSLEYSGNWICVNIDGMDYKTMIDTCTHEVAHEIFATECEDKIEECLEVAK